MVPAADREGRLRAPRLGRELPAPLCLHIVSPPCGSAPTLPPLVRTLNRFRAHPGGLNVTTNPLSKQGHVLRHQDSNLGILWGHKNSAHHRPASLFLVLSPEGRRGNRDLEKATGQLLVTEPAGSVAGPEPQARGNSEARRSLLRGAGRAGQRRGLGSRPANALHGCLSPREIRSEF